MTREFDDDPDPADSRPPEPAGHIGTTGPGALVTFGATGLVIGWLVRPLSIAWRGTAPSVGWLPVVSLFFVAVIVGGVAWSTHRALHRRREHLDPHRAVNRLVLAKSCALAGALVAGGYLGYALSWLGVGESELAGQRALHSLLAGLAGGLTVVGSLLLERACRVDGSGKHT